MAAGRDRKDKGEPDIHRNTGKRAVRRPAAAAVALLLVFLFVGPALAATAHTERSRRIRIEYDDLVDRPAVTHSGRTVGDILRKPPARGRAFAKGDLRDLQPFLEPFSFVLNDIVASADPPGGPVLADVADGYPPGSAQPAWAALFREGRYRLFAGGGRARLFLAGDDPRSLLRKYHGVVRHALLAVLDKAGKDRIALEAYAFRNDYGARALLLDPRPYVTEIAREDCSPKTRELPLSRLAAFFAGGPALEAVEVDDHGDIFLYGDRAGETVAGRPMSLADFAVMYRAVFHHGNNPPYMSLDRSADNRYAAVNFGGFLADTRVGSVLLEADRRFKTIISGVDPDTRAPVADAIRASVRDFRTVDERALFRDAAGIVQARFWFYPDRIRTVTDGRIGAVESYRFTADEERTDGTAHSYKPGREAVDHLNRNYAAYARAFPPFRELDAVGRMMAVVKWLQATGAGRRVDLDALLSVPLPPHETPRRSTKVLAVTDAVRAPSGDKAGELHKVHPLDDLLLRSSGAATDAAYVENAVRLIQRHDPSTLFRGGRNPVGPGYVRYTSASISGGVSMDPADIAPPRRAPDSPLLAKFRRGGRPAGASPRSGGAKPDAPQRRESPPRNPGKTPGRIPGEPRPADTAPRTTPASPFASPPPAKEIAVASPSYPGKIVAFGDPTRRDTIVLRRGGRKGAGTSPPGGN